MEDETYTVLRVVRHVPVEWDFVRSGGRYELVQAPPGRFYFHVYYNTRTRNNRVMTVEARDELEAYMIGNERIKKNKAKSERMQAAKKAMQSTSTS